MMNMDNMKKSREALAKFINSGEQKFTFKVDCHLSKRIDYIYSVLFPGWSRQRFYQRHLIAKIAYFIDYSPIKCFIYKLIGVKIGKGVFISPDVWIDPHVPNLVEIKDYAVIGYGARIFTHELSGSAYTVGRVEIGEGAIVGAYAIVRGGVTIGSKVTVPLNSVSSAPAR